MYGKSAAEELEDQLGEGELALEIESGEIESSDDFGNVSEQLPSIEETFKETFNITRIILLGKERVGKNKALPKFKSTYFNVDIHKGKFSLKPKFQLKPNFQKVLCRQFKRGVYKVFLEELERQEKQASINKYDFIRKFARFNKDDLPVFYFRKGDLS